MKAVQIAWDVDSPEELEDLPDEIEIPDDLFSEGMDDEERAEAVSDYITDVAGFCHAGFQITD